MLATIRHCSEYSSEGDRLRIRGSEKNAMNLFDLRAGEAASNVAGQQTAEICRQARYT
jgi:hypothetical protein